jgi:hypothetical protein
MTTGGDQFGPRQYRPGTGLIGATANAIKAALAGNPIAFLAYGVSGFGFYAIGKNKQSILGQPPDPSVAYLIHLRLAQQGLVIDPATGRVVSLIGKKNNQGFNLLLQNDP